MSGQDLDSSRGLGMTGKDVEWWKAGVSGWQGVGHPPLDPSTPLRMSGPTLGDHPHPPTSRGQALALSRSARGGLSARRTPRRIFDIFDPSRERGLDTPPHTGGWIHAPPKADFQHGALAAGPGAGMTERERSGMRGVGGSRKASFQSTHEVLICL